MLRTKALRKIFITTLGMFILVTVFSFPSFDENNVIRTNFEIEDIAGLATDSIYLINNNGYLVKTSVFIDSTDIIEKITNIINKLYISNDNGDSKLFGIIPNNVKINNISYDEQFVTIDFSNEFLDVSDDLKNTMITSIVYSIMELDDVSGVIILVDGNFIKDYSGVLDKKIGINNSYLFNYRTNISKVVVYYLNDINHDIYYVPVTKYLNDDREKIKIIVEELTTSYIYDSNLMSFLDSRLKLIDYKEEGDVLFLNFNDYLYDNSNKILEEVIYCISYSVFDNYDVNMIMFEVNNEMVKQISRNDI